MSVGFEPFLSNVDFTCFLKFLSDWYSFLIVGPGPIAFTLIFGASDFAKITVAEWSAALLMLYEKKAILGLITPWSRILIIFPFFSFLCSFAKSFDNLIGAYKLVSKCLSQDLGVKLRILSFSKTEALFIKQDILPSSLEAFE